MDSAFRSLLANPSRIGDDKPEYALVTASPPVGRTERRNAMSIEFTITATTLREMRP
jgi:hypothetical protein